MARFAVIDTNNKNNNYNYNIIPAKVWVWFSLYNILPYHDVLSGKNEKA